MTEPERGISLRSVAVGLAGVLFVSLLTPYNNYVVANTDLIGGFLPTGVVLLLLVSALANAVLRRWLPRVAFSRAEFLVALGMTLVACAFPAVGLMRYLPGHLVSPFHHAATNPLAADALREANLAEWLFPVFETDSTDPVVRGTDPVVKDFIGRATSEEDFWSRVGAVPWSAWVRPAITWGIFFAALLGAVVCLMVIFREQWVVAERLSFPLATIYLSLVEQPQPGRSLSPLFRSRGFWIALASVLVIDALYGLNQYIPAVPAINLAIDMRDLMAEPPLAYTEQFFKTQGIFFTIIGITFFMQSKVAFSLWSLFVVVQFVRMLAGQAGTSVTLPMEIDQIFGALTVFGIMILWLSRHRLWLIVQHMFRSPRGHETHGRYLSHRVSGWGLVACVLIAIAWLTAAGATVIGATVIVLMLLLIFTIVARVVAETGLPYVLLPVPINRPFIYALQDLPVPARTSIGSYMLGTTFSGVLVHDLRQSLAPFAAHALRIGDEERSITRRAGTYLGLLLLAMVVAYVAGGAASLYVHYNYALTLDSTGGGLDNEWGWLNMPRLIMLGHAIDYIPPRTGPVEGHSHLGFFSAGAGIMSLLSFLHLRYPAFPLHPIGYLMVFTWGVRQVWFSIFLGWLAKVVIIRLGGSSLLTGMRPVFLGLIVGEATAVAGWLIINLTLAHFGFEYRAIRLLPA